jgi:hypothetical protein
MSPAREAELLEIIRQKDEEIARLKAQNKLLEQKIDLLVRRIFGASSEKMDAAQLELLSWEPSSQSCHPPLHAQRARHARCACRMICQ